jgi:phosphatidylserine/phosphatidylglycerophosphate/cardiolipin synthase-like enzyme
VLFDIASIVALAVVGLLLYLLLFERGPDYRVGDSLHGLDDAARLRRIADVLGAPPLRADTVALASDMDDLYAGQLADIATATTSIHVEAYIFEPGHIASRLLAALAARAAHGVTVRVIVDSVGSLALRKRHLAPLLAAGGQVVRYHPLSLHKFRRWNNRTHRNLLIVDGCIGWVGGAGIADHWTLAHRARWRDNALRVSGEAVVALQSVFAENWLEAAGELLVDADCYRGGRAAAPGGSVSTATVTHGAVTAAAGVDGAATARGGARALAAPAARGRFPTATADTGADTQDTAAIGAPPTCAGEAEDAPHAGLDAPGRPAGASAAAHVTAASTGIAAAAGAATVLVVGSTPTAGQSTRARILVQLLLASARERIDLCTPYFIPDRGIRAELLAARARGVAVRVLTSGPHGDHAIVRRAGRRRYGPLLRADVAIAEYRDRMLHSKLLAVDACWTLHGSTNIDHRSFGLNDEVNVLVHDGRLATAAAAMFERDFAAAERVVLSRWQRRPWHERLLAMLGSIIERHQ